MQYEHHWVLAENPSHPEMWPCECTYCGTIFLIRRSYIFAQLNKISQRRGGPDIRIEEVRRSLTQQIVTKYSTTTHHPISCSRRLVNDMVYIMES